MALSAIFASQGFSSHVIRFPCLQMAARILFRDCWATQNITCLLKRPVGTGSRPPPRGAGKLRRMRTSPEEISESSQPGGHNFKLLKPLGFTLLFTGCSFTGAAIWQYENMRKRALNAWQRRTDWVMDRWTRQMQERSGVKKMWNSLSSGQQVASGIVALNAAVFLAWRIPRARGLMVRYFSSNPASKAVCWPMVLSTFSHYSFWHFGINMYVLFSFSTAIVHVLGVEQFMAVYLSAGVISSFASYVHKAALPISGISLGASGCLMAMLGIFCTQFPDAKLAIVFLPMFPFTASLAIKGIMALDAVGLVLGWKVFDHAAHLGGALFGISYALWGKDLIWANREPVMRLWSKLRGGA